MTDETTARDLAIELRSVAVDIGADWPVSAEILRDAATELDRLRALAGAPTPDVAESLAAWERDYVRALNAILAAYDDSSADAHRWRGHAEAYRQVCERLRRDLGLPAVAYTSAEWRQAHGVYSDEQVAAFRRLRPAAPEGVDAADALDDQFGTTCIDCGEAIDDRRPYAPTADGELMHVECGDDGMDLEAQGAMADELAAAQAANQRVRAECEKAEKRAHEMIGIFSGKKGADVPPWVGRIRRALDGDTTEEER